MLELKVTGMTCGGCVRAVERAVQKVPGVSAVKVDLPTGRVEIQGDADRDAVVKAVETAGYQAAVS